MEAPGLDFGGSGNDFFRFLQAFWHVASKTSLQYCFRNPSDDLSHVGRADAAKKMRICQIKERLPRIARLAHLNTQTPRTPRTPRAKNSTTTAENKRVGRRWSPPGGLQYFLCRRLPDTRRTRARPARRAGLALLFLVQETQETQRRRKGGGARLKSSYPNTEGGEI